MDYDNICASLDTYYRTGNSNQVEPFLQEALMRLQKEHQTFRLEYAVLLNELGGYYRNVGRYSEALHCQEEALSILRALGLQQGEDFAVLLCNTAATYRLTGDSAKSITLLEEAEALLPNQPYTLEQRAAVLNQLALTLADDKQYARAIAVEEKALTLIQQYEDNLHEHTTALNNLAVIYLRSGELAKALSYIEQALELYQAMSEPNIHFASALTTQGSILYAMGLFSEAIPIYRKALSWSEFFWGRESREYAGCCRNLAIASFAAGKPDMAADCITQAEQVYNKLYGPSHETVKDCQRLLASCREGEK